MSGAGRQCWCHDSRAGGLLYQSYSAAGSCSCSRRSPSNVRLEQRVSRRIVARSSPAAARSTASPASSPAGHRRATSSPSRSRLFGSGGRLTEERDSGGRKRDDPLAHRHATRNVPEDERPKDVPVERGYRKEDDADREEIVGRFVESVAEYKAEVRWITEDKLPAAIEVALTRRGVRRLVVPPTARGSGSPTA